MKHQFNVTLLHIKWHYVWNDIWHMYERHNVTLRLSTLARTTPCYLSTNGFSGRNNYIWEVILKPQGKNNYVQNHNIEIARSALITQPSLEYGFWTFRLAKNVKNEQKCCQSETGLIQYTTTTNSLREPKWHGPHHPAPKPQTTASLRTTETARGPGTFDWHLASSYMKKT